ncbi:hypothetical protein [Pseudoduganella sp.]|uniref:hypothetical protein n=1 Tax=Pseudoduganella sp. TaxID=1880898 RepID=UPI0035ADB182
MEERIAALEQELAQVRAALVANAVQSVARGADRDAWRALAEGMVKELKNPQLPRKLALPEGDKERAALLMAVMQESHDAIVARAHQSGAADMAPAVLPAALEECKALSQTYARLGREAMREARRKHGAL